MNLDTLFTVLFILMIVLFQIVAGVLKRAGRQAPESDVEDNNRPSEAGGRLQEIFKRIRDELEAAGEGATGPPPPVEQRESKEEVIQPTARETIGYEAERARRPAESRGSGFSETPLGRSSYRQSKIEAAQAKREESKYSPDEKKSFSPGAAPADLSRPDLSLRLDSRERIKALRRAVVWSEILAPPLALRRDREEI